MAYEPINDPSQLPSTGPLPEHLCFDMKTEIAQRILSDGVPRDELASDLAAFANVAGGTILVGAREEPVGTLARYFPVDHDTAQRVVAAYLSALSLCSPTPIIDPLPIRLSPDRDEWVVAVNVDAYAAPPIGVAKSGQDGGPKWWSFPVRRGDQNRPARPEELATIMDPTLRRMVLLLDRLQPSGDGGPLAYFHAAGGYSPKCEIVEVNPDGGFLRLKTFDSNEWLIVPIDAVRAVWNDKNGHANVGVVGQFTCGTDYTGRRHGWNYSFRG